MYPIPGPDGELQRGRRLLNYVWYRDVPEEPELDEMLTDTNGFTGTVSVHPGKVQQRYVDELRGAAFGQLSPVAAELVTRTAQPYIQPVPDVAVPRMVFGRVVLIGDAAFAARPHAAWEPDRLALGHDLLRRVREMGERPQVHGTWDPKDPALHFGRYGPDR